MNIKRMALSVGTVLILTVVAAGADFRLPLELRPDDGAGGMKCISNGVPLEVGAAMDTKELHVLGPDGKEVPAQFRVLARWWRKDNSIRWVLTDFIRSDSEPAKATYTLVGRKAVSKGPTTKLSVTETKNAIRIDTGPAQFEVSTTNFNLLNRVVVDGKTLVEPDELMGSVTEDPKGRKYYSSKGAGEVKIIDQGPVRVTLMAKGVHRSTEKGASEKGLYGYEIFMTFRAGQTHCDVDAILTNNFAKPHGEPHFEDWSLLTRLGAGGAWSVGTNLRTVKERGTANESFLLYQDSLGTDGWKKAPGVRLAGPREQRPVLGSFRGFKVWRVSDGKKVEAITGDLSDGQIICEAGEKRLSVVPRNFWQQFPSAIAFGGDGVLRISPFPREYKQVHWLEDATAKAQEFRLTFGKTDARAKGYLARTVALPSVQYCAKIGALGEFGPHKVTDYIAAQDMDTHSSGGGPLKEGRRRSVVEDRKRNNGFGWQVLGHLPHELAGHSPWNYEPLATSGKLFNFVLTGKPGWYEWGLACDRSARDVRAYLIDDQDNLAVWKTWRAYVKNCVREEWPRRLPNKGLHPYRRHVWPLPNMEHNNLDEVYDLYLLTGDDRARRCMETIAAHAAIGSTLKYSPKIRRRARRMTGWTIRTIARYYELTGDKRYKPYLQEGIDQIWNDVSKSGPKDPKGGVWQLGVYARGAINAYRAIGDERMRDLAIGCADWTMTYEVNPKHGYAYQQFGDPWNHKPEDRGKVLPEKFKKYWFSDWCNGYMLAMLAFAYDQTGDARYADAFDFAYKKNNGTAWLGFFPGELYMRHHARADSIAPAAVGDLTAKVADGKVTLTWTAPGDDGKAGAAAVYQIKYASKPILEFVPHPEKMDTHIAFWGSENVSDEPAPKQAGSRQSYTFAGLKPGKYYFAIKSRDESNNQSSMSKVAAAVVRE